MPSKLPVDKSKLDVSQIFLVFMATVGDVERTSLALNIDLPLNTPVCRVPIPPRPLFVSNPGLVLKPFTASTLQPFNPSTLSRNRPVYRAILNPRSSILVLSLGMSLE